MTRLRWPMDDGFSGSSNRSGVVHTAVLVEGESDREALLAVAGKLNRDLAREGVEIVGMGGATSIEHFVSRHGPRGRDLDLLGLCDRAETHYFERHLDPSNIFVCSEDLEDELIRALGLDEMLAFIEDQGELKTFRTMQKQPAQRDRTIDQHMHRFCGIRAGRKVRYAKGMIEWLPVGGLPEPLVSLVNSV